MGAYVDSGAMLKCTFGTAPTPLIATSRLKNFVGGKPVATEADKGSANVITFGGCMVTPTGPPCKPMLQKWSNVHNKVKFGGKAPLLKGSFCVCSKGGLITISNPGQRKVVEGAGEPKEAPCKKCGNKHEVPFQLGNNIGDSGILASSIEKNMAKKKDRHSFYEGAGSIQAHHLIICESMTKTKSWAEYVHLCGYDINHWKNGVFLPNRMDVACKLAIPLHRGNHDKGETNVMGGGRKYSNYPKVIKRFMREIRQEIASGEYCEDEVAIREELDSKSEDILVKLSNFNYKLTEDGGDYQKGMPGCKGAKTLPKKRQNPTGICSRTHTELNVKPKSLSVGQ